MLDSSVRRIQWPIVALAVSIFLLILFFYFFFDTHLVGVLWKFDISMQNIQVPVNRSIIFYGLQCVGTKNEKFNYFKQIAACATEHVYGARASL